VEPKYAGQFLGLSSDDIRLSPGGKIDAVTDGTISSKLIVEAIKRQLEFIGAKIKES
jgi:Na+-translocating ferredoxin:NAD+ oxidoreductase RnfG subunit